MQRAGSPVQRENVLNSFLFVRFKLTRYQSVQFLDKTSENLNNEDNKQ